VDGRDQRGGVDRGAEREGVLEEEEVRDVGEVGLAGVEEALEDAEVDEGRGFESVGDGFRIPRSSCADGERWDRAPLFLETQYRCPAGRARCARSGNFVAGRGLRLGASVGRELYFPADQREVQAKQ